MNVHGLVDDPPPNELINETLREEFEVTSTAATPATPHHYTKVVKKVKTGKEKGKEVEFFNCSYCDKGYQGPSSSTTLKHLRKFHPKKCPELLPKDGPTTSQPRNFFDTKKIIKPFNEDIFMGKLLTWIIRTDQPFSIVDNEFFEDMLDYLKKGI